MTIARLQMSFQRCWIHCYRKLITPQQSNAAYPVGMPYYSMPTDSVRVVLVSGSYTNTVAVALIGIAMAVFTAVRLPISAYEYMQTCRCRLRDGHQELPGNDCCFASVAFIEYCTDVACIIE